MNQEPVRMAVIGIGVMGERHARVIADMPAGSRGVQLAAIVDVRDEVLDQVGQDLSVPGYRDVEEMLANEAPDAVVVATSDDQHRAPAIAAMRAGCSLFLEKPVASTFEDAAAIVQAADRYNANVMMGHTLRYDPRYVAVAEAAQAGKFGDFIHLYARRNATTWSGQRIGGRTSVTVFQGVHDFDAIRWITGAEVIRVYAATTSKVLRELGVADTVQATLHLSNGAIAQVEQSWAVPYGVPDLLAARLEVVGTTGAAHIDSPGSGLEFFTEGTYSRPDSHYTAPGHPLLKEMLAGFVDLVRGEKPAVATLADGIAALKIALAVDRSAQTGAPIELEQDIRDAGSDSDPELPVD